MTIKQLIKILKDQEQTKEVYLSMDSEGNGFGTLEFESMSLTESGKGLIIAPYKEGLSLEDLK